MKPHKPFLFLCSLVLLSAFYAAAQDQLTPTEKKQRTVVTEPQTLYKGFLRAGMAFSFSTIDKSFDDKGKRQPWPTNIWSSSLLVQTWLAYGITNRLQVEVSMPYRVDQIYQSLSFESIDIGMVEVIKWKNKGTGLSDISITGAYQFITEKETRPSITGYLMTTIPTGEKNPTNIKNENEYDLAVGSGEASIHLELRLRKVKYPFSYSVYGSYQEFLGGEKILDPVDTREKPFRSGSNISVGGYFYFHLNDWIAFRNSADYFFSVRDEYDGVKEKYDSWVIQYYPGVNFQIKQFRIGQAVNVPLFGKYTSADPSYIIVVQYTF